MAAVRGLVRSRRRERTWTDRYTILFGAAVAFVLAAPAAGRAVGAVPGAADPARAGAGLALIALLVAGALAAARAFGPVALSPADAAWLLLSPLPRRAVLRRSALILLAVSAVAGVALGVALLAALGAPDHATLRLLAALAVGAATAVGGTSAAVLAQASHRWDAWLLAAIGVALAAAALAAVTSMGPGRHLTTAIAAAPVPAWLAAASASAAAAAVAARAWTALGRIPARVLLDASTRSGNATAAALNLDPATLTWIAEDARWRGRRLRSRPWPAAFGPVRVRGALAVAWQEWRRLSRRPVRLALLAAACAVPALTARAFAPHAHAVPAAAVAVLAAGALAAAAAATTGARRDADDPALARLTRAPRRAVLAARALLPALLGGAWLTLALTALNAAGALPPGPWWPFGALCAPALAAGALRMARRRPVDHALPVLLSPIGSLPTGPLLWALTGADLAALGCAPALQALADGPSPSLAAAQAATGALTLTAYLTLNPRP
ncbi:DUF6297 family protein [Actinomadura sp. J1-007]|uniref:DUF6297 family protein n=1 Tax=Actinomadura sp. J1-007 TaxID=2661913 RepID=UPI002815036C|nr:DUF6297 family protein [Actinomadura sp. J1-007]